MVDDDRAAPKGPNEFDTATIVPAVPLTDRNTTVGGGIYQPQGWLLRFIAYLIDFVIILIGCAPLYALVQFRWGADTAATTVLVVFPAVFLAYFIAMEGAWSDTLGKRAFGMKVLMLDERPCTWRAAIIRNVFKLLGAGGALITIIFIVLSKKSQRLGDMAAGTVVVKELADMPDRAALSR